MKNKCLIAMVVLTAIGVVETEAARSSRPVNAATPQALEYYVAVANYAGVDRQTLSRALDRTAELYRCVGVTLRWREVLLGAVDGGQPHSGLADASIDVLPESMTVRYASSNDSSDRAVGRAINSALGFSIGRLCKIRYDRVERSTRLHPELRIEDLLAHVFAHELAHGLLNDKSHSASGIMRAYWPPGEEMHKMSAGGLRFNETEARRLRRAVEALRAPRPDFRECDRQKSARCGRKK